MSRNGTGVFAVINPILIGALRSSSAVNQNCTDMGTQMTNTVPLDGSAAMTGQFKAADGALTLPSISFASGTRVGFRRTGLNAISWVVNGADVMSMDADGDYAFAQDVDIASGLTVVGSVTLSGIAGSIEALTSTGALHHDDEEASLISETSEINFTWGAGGIIQAGKQIDFIVPFAATITGIAVAADVAANAVIDIWKDTLANFPPTNADGICGSNKPTLASAASYSDATLTGWTTTVAAGDVIRFNLDSISTSIAILSVVLSLRRYA